MTLPSTPAGPATANTLSDLGQRIRKARRDLGITQQALASPRFTKAYVSAVERGAVRPSLKALEYFAQRLAVPVSELLGARPGAGSGLEPDLAALQEDLLYQVNYAKMLIRTDQVDEAFQVLADAEQGTLPYGDKLAPSLRYLVPFTRARAYLQISDPEQARPELEEALKLAQGDEEATVRVRNLLGVVFYELEQPQLALEQHQQCLHGIHNGVRDLNLRLSVYRNLANDYTLINQPSQAIGLYKEALTMLEDLGDLQRQAGVYWGLAEAYKTADNWALAKIYATRALSIYEAADDRSEAAQMCINLAEVLIGEGRFADAEQMLARAMDFLSGSGDRGRMSYLYQNYANLALQQGQLEKASEYAAQSIDHAEAARRPLKDNDKRPWIESTRIYAEALHVAALVEEALGHTEAADDLFRRALEQIEQTTIEETIHAINLSYAEALHARGAHEQAIKYFRAAARPRSRYSRQRATDQT
jgi:tetratricopeptide (TPR) repeat protein